MSGILLCIKRCWSIIQMETFDLDALVEESHQTLKEHGEGAV